MALHITQLLSSAGSAGGRKVGFYDTIFLGLLVRMSFIVRDEETDVISFISMNVAIG